MPPSIDAKDQRSVEAAVAGVAGLLLGRAIFGNAGGLAAGLAAVGAGLLARRLKGSLPADDSAAGEIGQIEPAAELAAPLQQTVARLETAPVALWQGWGDVVSGVQVVAPVVVTPHFTDDCSAPLPAEKEKADEPVDLEESSPVVVPVAPLAPPAAEILPAPALPERVIGELAEPVSEAEVSTAAEALGTAVEAAVDQVMPGAEKEESGTMDVGDLPPVPDLFTFGPSVLKPKTSPVPGVQTSPVAVAVGEPGREQGPERPAPSPEPHAPVEVLPPAAQVVDLAALVAAPLEPDEPVTLPAGRIPVPLAADEFPAEFVAHEVEPEAGPRTEFLMIPELPGAVMSPPPIGPVVEELAASINLGPEALKEPAVVLESASPKTSAVFLPQVAGEKPGDLAPDDASEVSVPVVFVPQPPAEKNLSPAEPVPLQSPPLPWTAAPSAGVVKSEEATGLPEKVSADVLSSIILDDLKAAPASPPGPVPPEPVQPLQAERGSPEADSPQPAPAPAGDVLKASPFMLWEPSIAPAAETAPMPFPAVRPPTVPVPVFRPEPVMRPEPLRPEPLLSLEPVSAPADAKPAEPDPEDVWRQAAAELASLKTVAVPVLPPTEAAPLPTEISEPAHVPPPIPSEKPGPSMAAFPAITPQTQTVPSAPSAPLPQWLQQSPLSAPAPVPIHAASVVSASASPPGPSTGPVEVPGAANSGEGPGEAKSFLRTVRLGVPPAGLRGAPLQPPPGFESAIPAIPLAAPAPVINAPPILPPSAPVLPLSGPAPAPVVPAPLAMPASDGGPSSGASLEMPVLSNRVAGLSPKTTPFAPVPGTTAVAPAPAVTPPGAEKIFVPTRKASPGPNSAPKPLVTPGRLILVAGLATVALGVTFREEIRKIWNENLNVKAGKRSVEPVVEKQVNESDVILKKEEPAPKPPLRVPPLEVTPKPAPLPPPPPVDVQPAPVSSPTKAAGPLPVNEIGAKELIARLLRGKSLDEVNSYIHDSARLAPDIAAYFSSGKAINVTASTLQFERMDTLPSTGRTAWQFLVTTDRMQSPFSVSVEDTLDGLRTDWEFFIQCRDDRFAKWMADKAAAPARFYSVLRRAHIFPDMLPESERQNFLAFELAPPIKDAEPVKAYIPKGSPIFDRAENMYVWETTHTPVLELTHKDGRVIISGILKENWRPLAPKRR